MRLEEMNDNEKSQFNILCLSGGGFRGLYTAKVLEEIEKSLERPVASAFDLIAGTSIGGIIAMAIALEIPASDIVKKFKEHGEKVFPPRRWWKPPCIFSSKYKQEGLKELVSELFDGKVMADIPRRLIIPTVNYSTGKPQFFKTSHHQNFRVDKKLKLQDIALATSAAPYYFSVYKIVERGSYVDGGLYGNSPGVLALHEAQYFLGRKIDDIHLLSIGTMSPMTVRDSSQKTNMGIFDWKEDIFSLTISVQEQIVDFQLKRLLKDRYVRIDVQPASAQEKNIGLDVVTEAAIDVLESQGACSAQNFLSDGFFRKILSHHASEPSFY